MTKANIDRDEWLDALERIAKLEKDLEEKYHQINGYLKNQSDARMDLEARVKQLEERESE
jgi:DNA-binding ferritin-like protein (Dps family)